MAAVYRLASGPDDGWDSDPRTEALRERIEDLEYELADARGETVEGDLYPSPWGTRFTPGMRKVINILASAAPKRLMWWDIQSRLYGDEERVSKIADNYICRARPLLGLLGLRIETDWGVGRYMTREDAEKWRRWCRMTHQGEPPAADYPLKLKFGWLGETYGPYYG